jgi:hypothetical protein
VRAVLERELDLAGLASGLASSSCATMPAMCGAAMEVPPMVLNVPMSVAPGR